MDEGTTSGRTTEYDAFTRCVNWKPVIAAVHGYCLGHALGTALYCDHLIAARDATFEVTEIKLGLPTASVLPRLGRPAFASEVAMTGRRFSSWRGRSSRTRSGPSARTSASVAPSWRRKPRATKVSPSASTGLRAARRVTRSPNSPAAAPQRLTRAAAISAE